MAKERLPDVVEHSPGSTESIFFPDADMAEVALLLPSREAADLERVAQRQGLTVGQLVRRLIRGYLACGDLLLEARVIDREAGKAVASNLQEDPS
jgi:hypothetical protein